MTWQGFLGWFLVALLALIFIYTAVRVAATAYYRTRDEAERRRP